MAEEGRKTAAMRCGVNPQTACLTAGKDRQSAGRGRAQATGPIRCKGSIPRSGTSRKGRNQNDRCGVAPHPSLRDTFPQGKAGDAAAGKGETEMDKAIKAIEAQQGKVKARSAPWMVGEQLKDMVRREPGIGELIHQDLTAGGMSLEKAEVKIKAFADKRRTGNFACVTPAEAEGILREYFGLPAAGDPHQSPATAASHRGSQEAEGVIDLADFF